MIKVWNFDFNQVPGADNPDYGDQTLIQRAFDRNLALAVSLEARGFEGVFYSEHHFIASMSPSPNLLVALLAGKTQRLKIGVMGNVLPFHQPWRLAEELNMLDYITHGRLEIGVSSGVPPEFLFINMPQENIRPIYGEVLDFLQLAEREALVSFKGRFIDLEDVPIMPRPRREPRRRHWLTAFSPGSCRDAARRGFKVCTGYQSTEGARESFDAYRSECAANDRSVGPDDLGLRRQILIAETDAEAQEQMAELKQSSRLRMEFSFKAVYERLERSGLAPAQTVRDSGVIDAASVPQGDFKGAPQATSKGSLILSDEEFICGSPASVAEQIIAQCRAIGAGNIMAYHPGTLDETGIDRNYRLWESVIPVLNGAGVPA